MIIIKVINRYYLVEFSTNSFITTEVNEYFAITTSLPKSKLEIVDVLHLLIVEKELREELRQAITLYK